MGNKPINITVFNVVCWPVLELGLEQFRLCLNPAFNGHPHTKLKLLAGTSAFHATWLRHPTISSSVTSFLFLPSIFPSSRVFSNESYFILGGQSDWNFSISPSSEYSELISFRIDQFDLLAVLCLLQHHNLKPSVFQHSTFFIIQHSCLEKPMNNWPCYYHHYDT